MARFPIIRARTAAGLPTHRHASSQEPPANARPYGEAVWPEELEAALRRHPDAQGVFVQATESSTGISHDVRAMGALVAATDAIFVVDAITGLGSSVLEIDAWDLDVVIGGSQKSLMIPPGLAYCSVSEKARRRANERSIYN